MWCVLFGYSQFRDISIGNGIVNVLEKKCVITFFCSQDIMEIICFKVFNVGTVGTQTILVDNELQVRMVLAQFAEKTPYGITFTVHFCLAVLFPDGFRGKNNHLFIIRVNNSCANRLKLIGDFSGLFIFLFQAYVGVARIRGKITSAVKIEEVATFHKHQFLKDLAPLQLSKGIFEKWPEIIGIDTIKDFAHRCVAGDAAHSVYGHEVMWSLFPPFIKSQ